MSRAESGHAPTGRRACSCGLVLDADETERLAAWQSGAEAQLDELRRSGASLGLESEPLPIHVCLARHSRRDP